AVPALVMHLIHAVELDPAVVDLVAQHLVHAPVGHSACVPMVVGNTSTRAPACPITWRCMYLLSDGLCHPACSWCIDSSGDWDWGPGTRGYQPTAIGACRPSACGFCYFTSTGTCRRNGNASPNRRPQSTSLC